MALRKNAKQKLLKQVPLFARCSGPELEAIGKVADELDFKEGKELAREGAPGREFFVIVTGTAEVTRGTKKLRTLSDGDFFGEISLITKLPRTASVKTVSPTRALVITDRAFRRMLDQSPAIQRKVLEALGERLERTPSGEAGKPMKAARVEAARAMSTYTYAAVVARTLAGDMIPMDGSQAGEGKLAFTLRVPIGVVGAISPFNFPLNLVAHKIAPALAAGCPVVLKPASQTPLSALLLAELEEEAGLPAGWLNVVAGSASELGDVLVADERVKLISFTGSVEVGWKLAERAARKRVTLELGNSTPVIVDETADLEDAATKLAANAFSFAGGELEEGLIRPTVLADAPEEASVCREEVFGPVVVVNRFEKLDEAIALANGTRFGLQAGIFTQLLGTALRAAQELEFGGVTVNEAPTFRSDQMPYGGVKDSGNTREGPAYAVRELTEERLVVIEL